MHRLLLLLCLAATTALAVPSREEAMAAITTLEKNLLSPDALDAAKVIMEYARDSEEVLFSVGPETMPWVEDEREAEGGDDQVRALLLAVYFAGNAKSQLLKNKTEDDPYAGWVAVLKGYRQLQSRQRLIIPALEELAELQSQGRLRDHAKAVKERERKADVQDTTERAARESI